MDRTQLSPLLRSFERYLRAANRSESTIATCLIACQQAERFLGALETARRANLEAYMGDLLARRTASTAATYYGDLLQGAQDLLPVAGRGGGIPNPMARMSPPMVPDQPVPSSLRTPFSGC